mmetsp:Transcript_23461/g.37618  ORF Transcript_23461/g.37618 Transcript_23461/m.37618 type:complete len:344 (+) Transcript_23461:3-1034(+)
MRRRTAQWTIIRQQMGGEGDEPEGKRLRLDPSAHEGGTRKEDKLEEVQPPVDNEENVTRAPEDEDEEDITLAVGQLQELQAALDKVNDEASDRVLEVEREFNLMRRPIFDQRNEVIASVEGFWRTAILNHPALSTLFTQDDIELLSYVTRLNVADFDDVKSGFVISVSFEAENPFFEDSTLVKEYRFTEEGVLSVSSTVPQWRGDRGAPFNAKDGDPGIDTGAHRTKTFFEWFTTSEILAAQNDPVADFIRDDLWPNPLQFFTGQVEWMNEDEDEDDEDADADEYAEYGHDEEGNPNAAPESNAEDEEGEDDVRDDEEEIEIDDDEDDEDDDDDELELDDPKP